MDSDQAISPGIYQLWHRIKRVPSTCGWFDCARRSRRQFVPDDDVRVASGSRGPRAERRSIVVPGRHPGGPRACTASVSAAVLAAHRAADVRYSSRLQSLGPTAHGGVWGMARVLRLEHASLRTQSTDISHCASFGGMVTAAARAQEAEVAWGARVCCVARLRASSISTLSKGDELLLSGVYTITGGLGGLGLRAGSLLVERGAARVVLASRSTRVARDGQGLRELFCVLTPPHRLLRAIVPSREMCVH